LNLYRQIEGSAAENLPFAVGVGNRQCAGINCVFNYTTPNLTIQPGSPVTIFAKANLDTPPNALLMDQVYFFTNDTQQDIVAEGVTTKKSIIPSGDSSGPRSANITIVPWDVLIQPTLPLEGQVNSITAATDQILGTVRVANYGTGKIQLTRAYFTLVHMGVNTTYKLYVSPEEPTDVLSGGTPAYLNRLIVSNNPNTAFNFTGDEVVLNPGKARYFSVTLDNPGLAKTGDTWKLSLDRSVGSFLGYSANETELKYDGNGNGNQTDTIIGLEATGKFSLGTSQIK
jgi:hypothetical protein